MSKALGSWSAMRKYLEQEMLATTLQGRVRYNCTRYVGMDDCHIFEIYLDNKLVKQFSWETVNSCFFANGSAKNSNPVGIQEYWQEFRSLLATTPLNARSEFTDEEFCEALAAYRNQSIEKSIYSDNPLQRMFAVLDRRLGQRTLAKLRETLAEQPAWLAEFYALRMQPDPARRDAVPETQKPSDSAYNKRTLRSNIIGLPYGLHDMHVTGLIASTNELIFTFADGFEQNIIDGARVPGEICFHNVDWDFCYAYVLDFCGNVGCFTGKKQFLRDFAATHRSLDFEIIDETYGYNCSKFAGYLSAGTKLQECIIEIYHLGAMEYITVER